MNYGTRGHPTQLFRYVSRLAEVFTSNGFCFCSTPEDCNVAHDATDSPCTMIQTTLSLYDGQYRMARDLDKSTARCGEQLDWPFEAGVTRDGMRFDAKGGNAVAGSTCSTLDRLPPFMYRYSNEGRIYQEQSAKRTTLDEGGVCHMGRPARLSTTVLEKNTQTCRTVYRNYTHIVVRCEQDEVDLVLEREVSRAPTWMVEHMRSERRKCGECSGVPEWWTENGGQTMPAGAEVSYGLPFRWSASRMLAGEVRGMLCGTNHNTSSECAAMLQVSEWTLDAFIRNLVDSPELLFSPGVLQAGGASATLLGNMTGGAGATDGKPDESVLWEQGGWVACDKYNGTCYGGISKKDWHTSSRADHCIAKFSDAVRGGKINSTTYGVDICNLNPRLEHLCQTLAQAKQSIYEANCVYAGACSHEQHVYTPGIYSITDGDFVRGTVVNYYEMYDKNAGESFYQIENRDKVRCPRSPQGAAAQLL